MFEKANETKALLEQKGKELQDCKTCIRILKVSRTLADLEGSEGIREQHIAEAF